MFFGNPRSANLALFKSSNGGAGSYSMDCDNNPFSELVYIPSKSLPSPGWKQVHVINLPLSIPLVIPKELCNRE